MSFLYVCMCVCVCVCVCVSAIFLVRTRQKSKPRGKEMADDELYDGVCVHAHMNVCVRNTQKRANIERRDDQK